MSRKVFLSFLGTNDYKTCNYYEEGNSSKKINSVKYIQEALLKLYCKDFSPKDQILIFLTDDARKINYLDNGLWNQETKNYDLKNTGLKSTLEATISEIGHPTIDPIRIKDGFSSEDIWSIFETISEKIQNNDIIILDITHAFRFLPMLGIVLMNYLKATKNIQVKGIYYGAFEKLGPAPKVENMPMEDRNAPILNLDTLLSFQSWTSAVNNFVKFGEASSLKEVSADQLNEFLKNPITRAQDILDIRFIINKLLEITSNLQTNRLNILLNQDLDIYTEKLKNLHDKSTEIKPFKQVIRLLEEKTLSLTTNNNHRWLEAAKWSSKHNLTQQAFTQFQEGLLTYFIEKINLLFKDQPQLVSFFKINESGCVDYLNENSRSYFGSLLYLTYEKLQKKSIPSEFEETVQTVIFQGFQQLATIFGQVNKPRNDINHAGMRNDPSSSEKFKKKIDELISQTEELIYMIEKKVVEPLKKAGLLNLSNHPSSSWPENQLKLANEFYGDIQDMPFPQIDPNADEEEIHKLATHYLYKILLLLPKAVHLMGELNFTFELVRLLQSHGITTIASTTHRTAQDMPDGTKISKFEFVRFRAY